MWTKSIIIDQSVKRIQTREGNEIRQNAISYAFAGFNAETKAPEWCTKAEHVKLYDTVADAVADAIKLREELPVGVLTYNIAPNSNAVQVVTVKF